MLDEVKSIKSQEDQEQQFSNFKDREFTSRSIKFNGYRSKWIWTTWSEITFEDCFLFLVTSVQLCVLAFFGWDEFGCGEFDEVVGNGFETEVTVEVGKAVDIDVKFNSCGHKDWKW